MFLKEEKGDSMLLLLFIIPLFVMAALIVFSVGSVYFAESHARTLLERSVSIAVDETQEDSKVRDLVFLVPEETVLGIIKQRIMDVGFVEEANGYRYQEIYTISDLSAVADGDVLGIKANLNVIMPWRLAGDYSIVQIPIELQSHILFMEKD